MLTRTKIDTFDLSWNPATGCLEGCPYCYARQIAKRFPKNFPNGFYPTFLQERLNDIDTLSKKGTKRYKEEEWIFTCSMGDLFSPCAKEEWQEKIIRKIAGCPDHRFFILTKRPDLIRPDIVEEFPDNLWLGVTTESMEKQYRIIILQNIPAKHKFISVEPMFGAVTANLKGIDWVIIGPQTNPLKLPRKDELILTIETAYAHNIPVFVKYAMDDIGMELPREWPA